jgi:hypothetical protein
MIRNSARAEAGQPLAPSAAAWNALLAGEGFDSRARPETLSSPIPKGWGTASTIVTVKNSTGDRLAGDVVRLISAGASFPGKPSEANRAPFLDTAAVAYYRDPIAITLDPIKDGKSGRAVIAGVVTTTVTILDDTHPHAEPVPGSAKLRSCLYHATARILGRASSGTGDRLCLVLLQNMAAGEVFRWARITGAESSGLWPATLLRMQADRATGETVRVQLLPTTGSKLQDGKVYPVTLIGQTTVSGTVYPLYDSPGSDFAYQLDCVDGVDGYREVTHLHPWTVGDFVSGSPPS